MQNTPSPAPSALNLERILAVIGMVICLIVSILVWLIFSAQQSMWPFPDLYLLEMLAVSILGTWGIWGNESRSSPHRGFLTWVVVGIFCAFVIVGSFSIGFWYMPVAGLFAIAALLADRRKGYNLAIHFFIGLAAALFQAILMFAIIRYIY
jgi:hypothetical protein